MEDDVVGDDRAEIVNPGRLSVLPEPFESPVRVTRSSTQDVLDMS